MLSMKLAKITIAGVSVMLAIRLPGACSVYDESLLDQGANGSDASATQCISATWPDPPKNPGTPGGDNNFVTALTYFDFGEEYTEDTDSGPVLRPVRPVGYNLDDKCTALGPRDTLQPRDPTLTEESSCNSRLPATSGPIVGDYGGGRDNGLSGLIALVKARLTEFGTKAYNANIKKGQVSLLIEVRDYNGEANDDDVKIVLYSPGAFDSIEENRLQVPQFDGEDRWPVAEDSYNGGIEGDPRFVSERAYVTNSTLVAVTADLDLRLRIGISNQDVTDLQIKFLDPFLTAKISRTDKGLWQLTDGVIAARWLTKDLFAELSRFPNPKFYPNPPDGGENPAFCSNNDFYFFVRDYLCSAADIYAGGTAPVPPCNALSVGIGFSSIQARLGPKVQLAPRENPCVGADPAHDSCDIFAAGQPPPP